MIDLLEPITSAGLLGTLGEDVTVTGATAWQPAAAFTIPAGLLLGGALVMVRTYQEHTNNANAKVLRARMGGQNAYGRSIASNASSRIGTDLFIRPDGSVVGTNWLGPDVAGATNAAQLIAAGVLDWSQPQTIEIGWEPTNAADVFTLRAAAVLVFSRAPR